MQLFVTIIVEAEKPHSSSPIIPAQYNTSTQRLSIISMESISSTAKNANILVQMWVPNWAGILKSWYNIIVTDGHPEEFHKIQNIIILLGTNNQYLYLFLLPPCSQKLLQLVIRHKMDTYWLETIVNPQMNSYNNYPIVVPNIE